jgi:hypothetical protein
LIAAVSSAIPVSNGAGIFDGYNGLPTQVLGHCIRIRAWCSRFCRRDMDQPAVERGYDN